MPEEDPWSRSILTPSPRSRDSDSNSENESPTTSKKKVFICSDAELARDLDISNRDDRAIFKETPFTMAKMGGGKKGGAGRVDEQPVKKRGNIQPATDDGRPPPFNVVPNKDKVNRPVEKDRPAPFRPQYRHNGWYDNHSKPVSIGPSATRQAPLKRSLIDTLDNLEGVTTSKAKAKAKATAGAKKTARKGKKVGDVDVEKVTFSRIRTLRSPQSFAMGKTAHPIPCSQLPVRDPAMDSPFFKASRG